MFLRASLSRFNGKVMALSLVCLSGAILTSCGSQDDQDEYRSELLGVSGTGEHEICANEVNVRNPQDITQVSFVSNLGDRVLPQGQTRSHIGFTFHLVEFKTTKQRGWVANDYICALGTGQKGAPKIEVNLSTNRLTFYRGTTVIRAWNVGTARAGKVTPVGEFKVRTKQRCPRYLGSDGSKNVAGCTAANPLGTRALWWQDTLYGLHGTNEPHLIAEGTTAAQRRLSAGCVRNLNANIEWLFDQVSVGDPIIIRR